MHKQSSMVVIQPSTGKILAIANNDGFNDFALTAEVAPGSTMKVITSTALFNAGVLTPQSPVACPPTYTVQGITYHNDQGESEPAGTPFITDFAQSCNNAFTTQWPHLYGALASTAKDVLRPQPEVEHRHRRTLRVVLQRARQRVGRRARPGGVRRGAADGLAARDGLGRGHGGHRLVQAADPGAGDQAGDRHAAARHHRHVPQGDDARRRHRAARPPGIGFGPTVYAKTGTADIQNQGKPNSWLIAFDPTKDVAVACLVLDAGYGAQFAGPEVKAFLERLLTPAAG